MPSWLDAAAYVGATTPMPLGRPAYAADACLTSASAAAAAASWAGSSEGSGALLVDCVATNPPGSATDADAGVEAPTAVIWDARAAEAPAPGVARSSVS